MTIGAVITLIILLLRLPAAQAAGSWTAIFTLSAFIPMIVECGIWVLLFLTQVVLFVWSFFNE
jgi:hypothetical protein